MADKRAARTADEKAEEKVWKMVEY